MGVGAENPDALPASYDSRLSRDLPGVTDAGVRPDPTDGPLAGSGTPDAANGGTATGGGGQPGQAGHTGQAGQSGSGAAGTSGGGQPGMDAGTPVGGTAGATAGRGGAGASGGAGAGGAGTTGQAGMGGAGNTGGAPPVSIPGLVARWTLDDATGTSGTRALDASGNSLHGTYEGTVGAPTRASGVPTVKFPDTAAAHFTGASDQFVRVANLPAALKPASTVTLSAWVRTTQTDGCDVASAGDSYVLRASGPTSMVVFINDVWTSCEAPGLSDGKWHHLLGLKDDAGLAFYRDGVKVSANCPITGPIDYSLGSDFVIGRNGDSNDDFSCDADIDDVRVYNRALTATEIAALAGGN